MIRLIAWSAAAQRELERVDGLDLADVEREVREGVSQLWECSEEGRGAQRIYGYVVTRVEQHGRGREWVWLACAGREYFRYVHAFLDAAYGYGLPIRVYVRRPGMRRIYERLGFTPDALIMRRSALRDARV